MPGTTEVGRRSVGIHGDADRLGPILGADTGRHTKPFVGVDADRERGTILVGIHLTLRSELELVGALVGERQTNPSAGFPDHEVDHFRRDELRPADQIALILAIFVIGDDYELTRSDVGNRLVDRSELHNPQCSNEKSVREFSAEASLR